jgi:hypothetical protein
MRYRNLASISDIRLQTLLWGQWVSAFLGIVSAMPWAGTLPATLSTIGVSSFIRGLAVSDMPHIACYAREPYELVSAGSCSVV